ncbi:hypothetical protein [Sphingomonas sp.]|jgi:hypothetical protein|uniref:hypothetical protein n=1 Tax=Sphingomonas sp. TaxID=28214 RepID=UPI002EDB1374
MGFFSRFSPVRAYRDLRLFLSHRRPHELGFLVLAMAITGFFVYAFANDSSIEPVYRRDIVYFEQWTLDRTDEQIRAQQKIDEPIRQKALAEQKKADDERRAAFRRLDKKLEGWGL